VKEWKELTMRVLVAASLLALLVGCSDDAKTPSRTDGDASQERVATAVRIARHYAAEQEASIRSATAVWSRGTVAQPNTDATCESGHLIRITLVGSFPQIVSSGGPPGGDGTSGVVTGVFLTADAESGQVCKISVTTGQVVSKEGATVLSMS
jgi:hypothetical protein